MFPQDLQPHTKLLKLPDHSMTMKWTTECMRRKWLRLKFIKDSMNGTGFPLTAFYTWQGSFIKKNTTSKYIKPHQTCSILSYSVFKPALQRSYSGDFKSEPLHHTSKSSAGRRHHPSWHKKCSQQFLTFQTPINHRIPSLALNLHISSIQQN